MRIGLPRDVGRRDDLAPDATASDRTAWMPASSGRAVPYSWLIWVMSGTVRSVGPTMNATVPDVAPSKTTPGLLASKRDRARPAPAPPEIVVTGPPTVPAVPAPTGSGIVNGSRRPSDTNIARDPELVRPCRRERVGDREVDHRAEEQEHGERRAAAPGEESQPDAADEGGLGVRARHQASTSR